jgi:hypothetical protein
MGIRIWLDDVRPMPEGFDLWAKNALFVHKFLELDLIDYISFDNDLGDGVNRANSGCGLADLIEAKAYFGVIKKIGWDIHSANPVARKYIEAAMKNADKYWEENSKQ